MGVIPRLMESYYKKNDKSKSRQTLTSSHAFQHLYNLLVYSNSLLFILQHKKSRHFMFYSD